MQHTDSTQPRVARNDDAYSDEWELDVTPGDAFVRLAIALLSGLIIAWSIEAAFIAINAPMM